MLVAEKKNSDKDRWVCVYPAYLNSKKTIAEGRRLRKDKCVENPTFQEIRDVLAAAGLTVGVENKVYPREQVRDVLYRGRVRVQLKNDDGTPMNSDFPTRESLLFHLGEMIPKLKTRQQKQGTVERTQPQQTGGAKKGKGKKGKR